MRPSFRAQLVTRRTYNRPLNDEGTEFETWPQTVDRVIGHQRWLWERAQRKPLSLYQEKELDQLRKLMLERKAFLAGRTLWLGGTDISRRRESSMKNCSFTKVEDVYDVVDCFWLLLQGCGVGFKPVVGVLNGFTKPIEDVEVIRSQKVKGDPKGIERTKESLIDGVWHIRVGDSAEAWAKLPGKLLAQKKVIKKLILDFSEIRAAGERLRGYGWISSGDATISQAMTEIVKILNHRAGQLLTAIDILDIMNWLGTTLSSRRSAEIALLDMTDPEAEAFANAKANVMEQWHRGQSNNSLLFWNKPTKLELEGVFSQMMRAGGSEPGFINAAEAKRRAPWFMGVNPCVTADTWIETNEGPRRVSELLDAPFVAMVDGKPYQATAFWKSGDKPVFRIRTNRGYEVRATEDHKFLVETSHRQNKVGGYHVDHEWVALKDLEPGNKLVLDDRSEWPTPDENNADFRRGWLLGEIVGDGGHNPSRYSTYLRFWGESGEAMAERAVSFVRDHLAPSPQFKGAIHHQKHDTWGVCCIALNDLADGLIEPGSKEGTDALEKMPISFVAGFLRGLFDADGSVQGSFEKGCSVRLVSADRERLAMVQRMLLRLGIASTVYECRQPAGLREMPDGNGGSRAYACKETHELVVVKDNIVRFAERVGFFEPAKVARLTTLLVGRKRDYYRERFTAEISEIVPEGVEAVYDCTVDHVHCFAANGIIAHNCSEILLGNKNFCSLVEVDWAKFGDRRDELLDAIWLLARANYRQTCIDLRDGVLSDSWHELNEFLHLCGVGATGLVKWMDQNPTLDHRRMMRMARDAAHIGSIGMAHELGLPTPKATTTVKPSGTLSKVADTTEGTHRPLGRYIFNKIQFSAHDPLVPILRDANYEVVEHPYDPKGSVLVTVPVEYEGVGFEFEKGLWVNKESAVAQLERYKMLMEEYVDHNVSVTVSYSPEEVPEIVNWLDKNWDSYVGVSWLFRDDPHKTAEDLGYPYLPQKVVDEATYRAYVAKLLPVDIDAGNSHDELIMDECATGACPVR